MYALVLLSVLGCACAAPQYYRPSPHFDHHRHHHHHSHDDFGMQPFFGDSVFDTPKFWSGLSSEMSRLDELLESFATYFPKTTSTMGVVDNQYQITISLAGFAEKDIVVKAREGLVMVQAVQTSEDGNSRTYMDVRSLPNTINVNGSWTFEQGVLKIVFPLKESTTTAVPTETSTEVFTTEEPKDREEIESQEHENTIQEADVGVDRGDNDFVRNANPEQDNEVAVEATTYAVDLTDDVEFVPVRY